MRLETMLYCGKVWNMPVSRNFLQKQLGECKVCWKPRICKKNTKLGTLNDSSILGEVLGMDNVSPMNGKYMLIKKNFFFADGSIRCA